MIYDGDLPPIPSFSEDWCVISKNFGVTNQETKTYLGRKTYKSDTFVSLTMKFNSTYDMNEFYNFWKHDTDKGALPFYIKLPVNSSTSLWHLVSQYGDLSNSDYDYTTQTVSGKFVLTSNITKDQVASPICNNITLEVTEGSQNVYIPLDAEDPNGLNLKYIYSQDATYGSAYISGSSLIYDSERGNLSTDTMNYRVYNGVWASEYALVTITFIARETYYLLVSNGDSFKTSASNLFKIQEDA